MRRAWLGSSLLDLPRPRPAAKLMNLLMRVPRRKGERRGEWGIDAEDRDWPRTHVMTRRRRLPGRGGKQGLAHSFSRVC